MPWWEIEDGISVLGFIKCIDAVGGMTGRTPCCKTLCEVIPEGFLRRVRPTWRHVGCQLNIPSW